MHVAVRFRLLVAALVSLIVVTALVAAQGSPSSSPAGSDRSGATAYLLRAISHGLFNPNRPAPGGHTKHANGLTSYTSYNWSGYADDNSSGTTYTHVSANWTEPSVKCPSDETRLAAFWVGLDGFGSNSVEQDGTLVECYHGSAYHYTWWEMYPTNSVQIVGMDVAVGDHISASVDFGTGYTLKVTDSTNPDNSFVKSETCGSGVTCSNGSAEWIAESPGTTRGQAPIPNFRTWRVTGAKVSGSGTTGSITKFPNDSLTMINNDDEALATPGALSANGAVFSDTWNYAW